MYNYCKCGRKCNCDCCEECNTIIDPKGPKGDKGDKGDVGPQGPQGVRGLTGPQGVKGDRGIMGSAGPQGIQGERGRQGIQGVKGDRGDNGITPVVSVAGTLTGEPGTNASVTETFSAMGTNLLFTIPKGAKGDKGDQGIQGAKGDKGDSSAAAGIIPFSISKNGTKVNLDSDGNPQLIAFAGFSSGDNLGTPIKAGEWKNGLIKVGEDSQGYGAAFVMPNACKLKKIYAVFSPSQTVSLETAGQIAPFVCLALCTTNDLVFRVLKNTISQVTPYDTSQPIYYKDIKTAKRLDLDVDIPEGALVAILVGATGKDLPSEKQMTVAVYGSLYFE